MSASEKDVSTTLKAELKERDKAVASNPLTQIVKAAFTSGHPLVLKAMQEEQQFRKRTQAELDQLLEALHKAIEAEDAEDFDNIHEVALKKLSTDLQLVGRFNEALKAFSVGFQQPEQARYPLKFNKMDLAIKGALDFLQGKGNFEALCQGQAPESYCYHTKPWDITILGVDPNTLYGSSKGTFFKTAALNVYLACSGKAKLSDLDLSMPGPYSSWIDNSAMVHTATLPTGLELTKLDESFAQFTYSFDKRFVYVHSGYAFGDGLRGEGAYYTQGKAYTPRDCSSWVEAICGSTQIITTADQLYQYRIRTGVGTVSAEWASSPSRTELDKLFDVVKVSDPQRDIQPGQIYCHRTFNLKDDPKMEGSLGAGGHTGVVLGFISQGKDSQVVVQAYSRDMPAVEGFGVQQFPLFPEPWNKPDSTPCNNKVMIFSTQGKAVEYAAAALASSTSEISSNKAFKDEQKASNRLS